MSAAPRLFEGETIRRLDTRHALALQYIFTELEAELGLRSSHGTQVDAICGLTGTGSHLHMSPVEVWACWSRQGGRTAPRAAYRALVRMTETPIGSKRVTVLHRVYGPRDPNARYDLFGELAPLAEYTDAVDSAMRRFGTVSTGEALRRRLTLRGERIAGESPRSYAHRQTTQRMDRTRWMATVRRETEELLDSASTHYRRALEMIDDAHVRRAHVRKIG